MSNEIMKKENNEITNSGFATPADMQWLNEAMSEDCAGIELQLDVKTIISRAHRRNIAVQYWTINDADEMRRLIELGCDCIMTDDPELLRSDLEEYKNK